MDQSCQGCLTAAGARLCTPDDFHADLLLLAGTASFGALASWRVLETRCRNIWHPAG